MTLPQNIPYNPSLKLLWFFALAAGFFAASPFFLLQLWYAPIVSAIFFSIFILLLLRHFQWPQHLVLTEHSMTVPSGFLRLRPKSVPYDHIERVWIVHIVYTSIICIRSANGQVEIQDLFLPDAVAFRDLYQFLELKAQSSSSVH